MGSHLRHFLAVFLPAATCLLLLAGCNLPAQLVWSPDGSRAVYRVGADAYLVEHTGRVIEQLGPSTGGYAWSGDGKRLYYATALGADGDDENTDDRRATSPLTPVWHEWFAGPEPPFKVNARSDVAEIRMNTGGGRSRVLCRLGGQAAVASLSPDENWLAVVMMLEPEPGPNIEEDDDANADAAKGDDVDGTEVDSSATVALYAISLRSGRVYLLGYPAFLGMAFTAPGRLAYLERGAGRWNDPMSGSRLVEVAMGARRRTLKREQPYGDVGAPLWLRPLPGGDLLILSVPAAVVQAASAQGGDGSLPPATLYRFERATGRLQHLTHDLSPMLSVSPDGRRLLAARVNPPATPDGDETHELVLMNADGSHVRRVRRLDHPWLTLWPSWRDAEHFLLPSEESVGHSGASGITRYAIEEYRVGPDAGIERVRTLSAGWDEQMLPYWQEPKLFRKVPAALTHPATQPPTTMP